MWLLLILATACGTSPVYGEKVLRRVTYPLTGQGQEGQQQFQQQQRQQKQQQVIPALQGSLPCTDDGSCAESDCAETNLVALSIRCKSTIREQTRNVRCVDATGYKRCLKDVLRENKCSHKNPETLFVRAFSKLQRESPNMPALCLPGVKSDSSAETDSSLHSDVFSGMNIGLQASQILPVPFIYYGNPGLFVNPKYLSQTGFLQDSPSPRLDIILIGYPVFPSLSLPEEIRKERQQLINNFPKVATGTLSSTLLAKDISSPLEEFRVGHVVETSVAPKPTTRELKSGVKNNGGGNWRAGSNKRLYVMYGGTKKSKLPNMVSINTSGEDQVTVGTTGDSISLGGVKGLKTLQQVQQQFLKRGKHQHKIRVEAGTLKKLLKQAASSPMSKTMTGIKSSGNKLVFPKKGVKGKFTNRMQLLKGAVATNQELQSAETQAEAQDADGTATRYTETAPFASQDDDQSSVQIVYNTNPLLESENEGSLKVETTTTEMMRSDGKNEDSEMNAREENESNLDVETSAVQHQRKYQIVSVPITDEQAEIQQKPLIY